MSKDNAEQLLNAALQEEKATQERLKKAMRQKSSRTNCIHSPHSIAAPRTTGAAHSRGRT